MPNAYIPPSHLEYHDDNTTLEAYVAYPQGTERLRPLVLIAPAWAGRDEFACHKADKIAKLGYIGFALDMYGKGIVGSGPEENSRLMSPFMQNRTLLAKRMQAAFQACQTVPGVDTTAIAAMGFCFGGLCALDLARSGAQLRGVVSFHGLLTPPHTSTSSSSQLISAKVLALHGFNDPMATPEQAIAFGEEMEAAGCDWQMHVYGHTMHAFTNPQVNDLSSGLVYKKQADRRSWQAMQNFFAEIFEE